MKDHELKIRAKKVAGQQGFELGKEIYRGTYYRRDLVRNLIFAGKWKKQPAILKIWNDPRGTDEFTVNTMG